MRRAEELLQQGRASYEIAGKTVSKAALATDAQARLGFCKQLETEINSHEKLLQQLQQAIDQGRANFAEAQRVRGQLFAELEGVKAGLSVARMRREIAELTGIVRDRPVFAPDSELARLLTTLKDRARAAERDADALANEPKSGGTIQWEQSPDTLRQIGEFLAAQTGKKNDKTK